MRRYYGILFFASMAIVVAFPSAAFAAKKGIGSIVGIGIVVAVAFVWYLIKCAIRKGKDIQSDAFYHDAMKSGQLVQLDSETADEVNNIVKAYMEAAYNASCNPDVDLKRLQLSVYDGLMTSLKQIGVVVSPELRKQLLTNIKAIINSGVEASQKSSA